MNKTKNKWSVTKKQCVETGMTFTAVFIVLGLVTNIQGYYYLAVGLAVTSILLPILLYPLAFLWFGFSKLLGAISSLVLLTVIFFLVVTPVAVLRRLSGKDSLQLKDFKKARSSVFTSRNHSYLHSDMEHMY